MVALRALVIVGLLTGVGFNLRIWTWDSYAQSDLGDDRQRGVTAVEPPQPPLGPGADSIGFDLPWYPPWLAEILAPLGVNDAKAVLGFYQSGGVGTAVDVCAGLRNWQEAAAEGQLFALYWLATIALQDYAEFRSPDRRELLWYLQWAKIRGQPQRDVDALLRFSQIPEDLSARLKTEFETWSTNPEPLPQTEYCERLKNPQ